MVTAKESDDDMAKKILNLFENATGECVMRRDISNMVLDWKAIDGIAKACDTFDVRATIAVDGKVTHTIGYPMED